MSFRRKRYTVPVVIVTLASFLLALLPPVPARADLAEATAAIGGGAGGPPTLAGPTPTAETPEGLATVNIATGDARSSFQFELPPARGQAQPSLGLSYDSSLGVGFAGFKWTLAVPSIVRKGTSGMPQFTDPVVTSPTSMASNLTADDYYIDGQLLVPVCTLAGGSCANNTSAVSIVGETLPAAILTAVNISLDGWTYFRRENDDGWRYFLSPASGASGSTTWLAQTKAGDVYVFGDPQEGTAVETEFPASIEYPDTATTNQLGVTAPYRWNLVRQYDTSGNVVIYQWALRPTDSTGTKVSGLHNGIQYLTDVYDTSQVPVDGFSFGPFAHHVHLSWSARLPGTTAQSNPVQGINPIWRAVPGAHLTTVDVTSATMTSTSRQLVRRYHLAYGLNSLGTRDSLQNITLEGRCSSPVVESSSGTLPSSTGCPTFGGTTPLVKYSYTTDATLDLGLVRSVPVPAPAVKGGGIADGAPWNPGAIGYSMVDVNGDGATDFVYGPINSSGLAAYTTAPGPYTVNVDFGPPPFNAQPSGVPFVPDNLQLQLAPGNPPGLQASLVDLNPNSVVYGDWLSNGQLNWLFMNTSGGGTTTALNGNYEIYTPTNAGLVGVPGGKFPTFPTFVTQQCGEQCRALPWQSGSAVDVDGDGLSDQALTPFAPPGDDAGVGSVLADSFLTQHNRSGSILPFATQLGAGSFDLLDPANYSSDAMRSFADMDGDGIADVVIAYKESSSGNLFINVLTGRGNGSYGPELDGNSAAQYTLTGGSLGSISVQGSFVVFGDLNGDGLGDYVVVNGSGAQVCERSIGVTSGDFQCVTESFGALGMAGAQINPLNDPLTAFGLPPPLAISDIDGDGQPEILVWGNNAGADAFATLGRINLASKADLPPPGLLTNVVSVTGLSTTIQYDYLKDVLNNGLGSKMPLAKWVATGSTTTNQLVAKNRTLKTTYAYSGPIYDARDRLFAGFRSVTESHPDDVGAPGLQRTTIFATSACNPAPDGSACRGSVDYSVNRVSRGLPVAVQEQDDVNGNLRTTLNLYSLAPVYSALDGRTVTLATLFRRSVYLWDPSVQSTAPTQSEPVFANTTTPNVLVEIPSGITPIVTEYDYDVFGNLGTVTEYGRKGVDPVIETARTWKLPPGDTSGWNYRVTTAQVLSAGSPVSTPARTFSYSYDPKGRLTGISTVLTGTHALQAPANMSRQAGAPPDASVEGSTIQLLSNVVYDVFGNLLQATTPNGRCLAIQPDPLFTQLPVTQQFWINCDAANPLTISRSFDRGFNAVTMQSTPYVANEVTARVSTIEYDPFGRPAEFDQPDPTMAGASDPAMFITYVDAGPVRQVHIQTADGPDSSPTLVDHYRFLDGFGDTLNVLDEAAPPPGTAAGQFWNASGGHTVYSNGLVKQVAQPVGWIGSPSTFPADGNIQGESISVALSQYDGLGRVQHSSDFLGNVTKVTYAPATLSVTVQDPEQLFGSHAGSYSTLTYDGHGRATSRLDHLNSTAQGAVNVTTTTTYQATGEPKVITRGSYTRWMDYDSLGRMVFNAEPNSSTNFSSTVDSAGVLGWTYVYNDSGDLVGTSDARGCGENIFHDSLGRVVAEDYSPCLSGQAGYTSPNLTTGDGTEAFYTFDDYSELQSLADRGQVSSFTPDQRGRVTSIQKQIASPPTSQSQFLAARYAPHVFGKTFGYSAANRVTSATTGADVTALLGAAGKSEVDVSYTPQGTISSATSPYGVLLASQQVAPSGSVLQQTFGDAAQTTGNMAYDANGRLVAYTLQRPAGPWTTYAREPPIGLLSSSPNDTLQGVGTSLALCYDRVGNLVSSGEIPNASCTPSPTMGTASTATVTASQWPAGAEPASRNYTYWDDYRLAKSTTTYLGPLAPNDLFVSPYEPEALEVNNTYPQPAPTLFRSSIQTFQYDPLGNTTSTTDDASDFYDRSLGAITNTTGTNQVQSAASANGNGSLGVRYDAAGNVLTVNVSHVLSLQPNMVFNYTWDEVGRLASAERTDNGVEVVSDTFTYDASGQQVTKGQETFGLFGETSYRVDVFDSLALQNASFPDANGDYERRTATERLYLNAGGALLGHVFFDTGNLPEASNGSKIHVFMPFGDPLGSTSIVIDHDTGELVERATYQGYGAPESDYRQARWGNFRDDVRYTGHEDDSEVAMVNFGARFYAPQLGRFMSPDPLTVHGLAGDLNPYALTRGSPVGNVDPLGLDGDDTPVINLDQAAGPQPQPDASEAGCGAPPCTTVIAAVPTGTDDAGPSALAVWQQLSLFVSQGFGGDPAQTWVSPITGEARWNPYATSQFQAMVLGTSLLAPTPRLDQFAANLTGFLSGGVDRLRSSLYGPPGLTVGIIPIVPALGPIAAAEGVEAATGAAQGASFTSFGAFKSAVGAAGEDVQWHHIVEQTPGNLARFGSGPIQNTGNLIRLDTAVHRQISGFYSSIQPFSGGATVRSWLSAQPFELQQQFGQDALIRFGVGF
ncbi:MAG: RHS repeat-associated core domain-containing protein [Polyangiaceae bacterium]